MQSRWFKTMAVIMFLVITACGGGGDPYGEAIAVHQEFVDAMESYLNAIEIADSGSAMAAAMDAYADKIETLAPRMKAVASQYPQWKDQTKIPEALKPLTEKAQSLAQRMAGSFMKAMRYMQDPEVQAAQQRLAQSMTKMQ